MPQVGLFARTELAQVIPVGFVIHEEKPLAYYQELPDETEIEIDPISATLCRLEPEKKRIYNSLYCSPELPRSQGEKDVELGRWWTNRYRFFLRRDDPPPINSQSREMDRQTIVEAVYQHASAIDHSCFNSNAEARLKPDDASMTLQIVAKQEIKAGDEILIHYDWEDFHDLRSGRRNKKAHTVHSDLWTNRGFSCEDCIFESSPSRQLPLPQPLLEPQSAGRRRILTPASPTATLRQKVRERQQRMEQEMDIE